MTESIQILMEKDRLQPLADNIKVLKGSDSITLQQMEDTIEETNTDIISQTDLIAQLASALQGKSVPGGGGASVETASMVVSGCQYVFYTSVENGELVAKCSTGSSTSSIHEIVVCCNMPVVCGRLKSSTVVKAAAMTELGRYSTYVYACTVPYDVEIPWHLTIGFGGGGST